jgi:hypothetical protein
MSQVHDLVEVTKDIATLLREALIIFVIVGILFWSSFFERKARDLGITKFDAGGMTIELAQAQNDTQKAATQVSAVQQQINDLSSQIQNSEQPGKSGGKENLNALLAPLLRKTMDANESLTSSLLNQQQLSQKVAQNSGDGSTFKAAPITGWVFLGQVDEAKTAWSGEGAQTVSGSVSPRFHKGEIISLTRPTLLYGEAESGHHLEGGVIKALPQGAQLEVLSKNPDYSHAVRGGNFIWLKVEPS